VAFEPIVGRYMHLELFGREHRIYLEQAGEGVPLLCLHTAGSDRRQYRALMNDARITKGLGHFPMSENPTEFLKHLLPLLEKIAQI
jgi:hypothetical protein